jgi:hypothetical protein
MRVELTKADRFVGGLTFWRGELDFGEVPVDADREELTKVIAPVAGKPFTYAWGGFGEAMEPFQHEPDSDRWFEDVLFHILAPRGYHYVVSDTGEPG